MRIGAMGIAVLFACGCAASADLRVCPQPGACEAGQACVLGRCRPADVSPSPADSTRFVLEPVDLAVVASRAGGGGGDKLPDAVAIGRASSGSVRVLMRFAAPWKAEADVVSAFVVLSPIDGSPTATAPATIEAAKIIEPWTGSVVTWGRQPRLGVPELAASLTPRPSLPLRVDVTALVRRWSRRDRDDNGIALIADGSDAFGVAYSLGAQGPGPRLEAYVR